MAWNFYAGSFIAKVRLVYISEIFLASSTHDVREWYVKIKIKTCQDKS